MKAPAPSPLAGPLGNERGGIVTGWLFRMVLVLLLFGIVVFEAGAVVVAKIQVDGVAITVAEEAGREYYRTKDPKSAEDMAAAIAEREESRLVSFQVSEDGRAVVVTIEKRAKTLFLHNIGATEPWTHARSTHEGAVR